MLKKISFFLFKSFVFLVLSGLLIAIFLSFYYSRDLPDYSQLSKYYPPLVTRIYSSDGKLIEEYSKEYRVFVPINSIPRSLINAFIAAEDKNFYLHDGIDYVGIVRASISNIVNIIRKKRLEGASTITQQVVKNFILTNERSFNRKIKEAILAYMVSKKFTKDQILELYLNQIFLGKNSYGVASASIKYFGKSVEDLTLEEAALLGGMPKAPSSYNPVTNYNKALERRNYVLRRMYEDGYISKDSMNKAIGEPIILKKRDKERILKANYFADRVKDEVIKHVGSDVFYTAGLNIFTTINSEIQTIAEEEFKKGIINFDQSKGFRRKIASISLENWKEKLQKLPNPTNLSDFQVAVVLSSTKDKAEIAFSDGKTGVIPISEVKWAKTSVKSVRDVIKEGDIIAVEKIKDHYGLRQIPVVNGALLIVEPSTGRVLAHVGGYDYNGSKFDRVSQAKRQPGSAIKPFVYLAALENNVPPNTLYNDGPITLSQGKGMPVWKPKNYKGNFLGDITLRQALEKSRNLVTVRIAKQLGISKIVNVIKRFGINDNPLPYYSMVLGSIETTLEKMTTAYGMIANQGSVIIPEYIELIQDRKGKIIYRRDQSNCHNCTVENLEKKINLPNIEKKLPPKIVDSASIYQLTSIMQGVIQRGTATRLISISPYIAGKTGTTNNSYDTWFIGFTPDIVAGCYVGYDNPASLGNNATGSSVTLPIIKEVFARYYKNRKVPNFEIPDTIQIVKIDKNTGFPSDNGIDEAFRYFPGSSLEDFYPSKYHDNSDTDSNVLTEEDRKSFYENIGELY